MTTTLTSNRITSTGLPLPSYLEQECFCGAQERRKSSCVDTSLNSLIPLDMSWLQITEDDDNLLKFDEDGYVWYFEDRCPKLPVLGWRVTADMGQP
jgi:hypothetical protein